MPPKPPAWTNYPRRAAPPLSIPIPPPKPRTLAPAPVRKQPCRFCAKVRQVLGLRPL
jgi:hypothetical protein